MGKLDNRVTLVTGAGPGIGKALALAFAAEGANVAVAARTASELDQVVSEINAGGGESVALTADLSDRSAPVRLVEQVKQKYGAIEVLLNNAGIGSSADPRPLVDFDDDFWDLTLAVNLTAPYLLCKAVLPDMLAGGWGRIITIASINGRRGALHGAAYASSKHAVLGLTRSLALEVATAGITVNAINPGPVKTLMNDKRVAYDAKRLQVDADEYEAALTPIGGRLVPDDLAPMAVYLASDDARMVTGQAFNIDGGLVMS